MTTTNARAQPHPPHIVDVGRLPRHPLHDGGGGTKEIWTVSTPGLDLVWQLKLLELRGPAATLRAPAHTHQLVIGMSGPQVHAGPTKRQLPLRRDQAMFVRSPTALFSRARMRMPGASRVLVLSFTDEGLAPQLVFDTLDGASVVPSGTQALVLMEGHLDLDGVAVPPESAVILDAAASHTVTGEKARIVIVSLDAADEAGAPTV